MTTIEPLSSTGAPSSRQLLRSTAIALGIAIAILVAIVLPAEYGVDPMGVGRVLGLKEMGETELALAKEAAGHDEEGVAFRQEISGTSSSGPAQRVSRGSAVLEKVDGRWIVVHLHLSR